MKSAQAALAAAQANVEVLAAQQNEARARRGRAADRRGQGGARSLLHGDPRAGRWRHRQQGRSRSAPIVQPGARLAALVPLTSVHVDANFKETQLASLKPGQKVHIEVDAFPDTDIVGTVESVSPASGAVFSLLPPENATGNFTKIVQRVPVRVAVSPDVAQQGPAAPRPVGGRRRRYPHLGRARQDGQHSKSKEPWPHPPPSRARPQAHACREAGAARPAPDLRVLLHGLRHVHGDPGHPDRLGLARRDPGRPLRLVGGDLLGADELPDRRSDHDPAVGHALARALDALDVRDRVGRLHAS